MTGRSNRGRGKASGGGSEGRPGWWARPGWWTLPALVTALTLAPAIADPSITEPGSAGDSIGAVGVPTEGVLPAKIGDYVVRALLGEGGEASVFLASHPRLGSDVAVKWARANDGRLEREGRLLGRLHASPYTPVPIDLGEHEGLPYLVLDRVRGISLGDLVYHRPPRTETGVAIARDLARGVGDLHRVGYLHQDIKPGNVLVDERGEVRLIDLGMARPIELDPSAEEPVARGGTLMFMAPEQAREEPDAIGVPTDVFAIGATLYFTLTGLSPFEGRDVTEVWERARQADFDRTMLEESDVPTELRAILDRAMAVDPGDRYESADAFADALEGWLARG